MIFTLAARDLPASLLRDRWRPYSPRPDFIDQYRRAAGYLDRILRSEKPTDLAVQPPSKYELAIKLKTAKPLGRDAPPTQLERRQADQIKSPVAEFTDLLCRPTPYEPT
jgi:hypothetical protein